MNNIRMVSLLLMCAAFTGCNKQSADDEYRKITASGLQGQELLSALSEFEVQHTAHFAAKVDLGSYYLLTNNYSMADYYLRRAESVIKNAGKTKEAKKNIAVLYGSLSQVRFMSREYGDALSYVDKALKSAAGESSPYEYLKGQILFAQADGAEAKKAALSQFERAYRLLPEKVAVEDIDALVKLYAEDKNFDSALRFLSLYYEKGVYYPDFGILASSIYEAAGEYGKSILCAFLDIDYYRGKIDIRDDEVQANLARVKEALLKNGHFSEAESDFALIQSFDDMLAPIPADVPPSVGAASESFFVRDYFILEKRILSSTATQTDVERYLQFENFFKHSPRYYANAWLALTVSGNSADKGRYLPVLEKMLALKPGKELDSLARLWIGNTIGLSASQSAHLLLPFEVNECLERFSVSRNTQELNPVYALFELPDNAYSLNALVAVKNRRDALLLRGIFEAKFTGASAKLRERLSFVLQ